MSNNTENARMTFNLNVITPTVASISAEVNNQINLYFDDDFAKFPAVIVDYVYQGRIIPRRNEMCSYIQLYVRVNDRDTRLIGQICNKIMDEFNFSTRSVLKFRQDDILNYDLDLYTPPPTSYKMSLYNLNDGGFVRVKEQDSRVLTYRFDLLLTYP